MNFPNEVEVMNTNIIEVDTDHMQPPKVGDDLFTNRASMAEMQSASAEVTIMVLAYNRLEKTKRCVESVLKYTRGIDYELILIDNGSTDRTLEYFKSVQHEKKRIIHVTKNVGAGYPYGVLPIQSLGRYICTLANDLIVTENWMKNLLACMKSDPQIGMVNPVSNNTSNLQCVNLQYASYEEMQKKAKALNISDPRKWEDRQRIITLGMMYRKEVLLVLGFPVGDLGYFHDFSDDDLTFAIRRAGYRTVLAGDTWICHDHEVFSGEGKDPVEFQRSINIGRQNFRDKYFGVDAWDDVNNYLIPHLKFLPEPGMITGARVLGVDVKCGTPILDIKNWLRKYGIFSAELSAFTQDAKYWIDLKTICQGPVICDREEFLLDSFPNEHFDYVVADRPINRYHEPQKILNDLFAVCKKGGTVICKLKNTHSYQEYVNMLGKREAYDSEPAYNITMEEFAAAMQKVGNVCSIVAIPFDLDKGFNEALHELLPEGYPESVCNELVARLMAKEFLFVCKKL